MIINFKSKFKLNCMKYSWITAKFCIWTYFTKKLYNDSEEC